MLFLYDLPNWLLGLVVVGAIILLGYILYFGFHRLLRAEFTDDNRSVALTVLDVIATINSLLLAFSAVSVWESFSSADAAVAQEANSVSALARDLAVYGSPQSATVVLPPTRFNMAMVGALSLSIGLVFYFIVAMDRPFAGKESISPEPFQIAIGNMERWDTVIAPKSE